MGKNQKIIVGMSSIALLAMLTTGCGSSQQAAAPSKDVKPAETAQASKAALPKVTIMVGGLEKVIYLPYKLTENLGYFKNEGLTVELINEAAGQSAEESLIAGEIQGVGGFYDHTIDMQSKGKALESVVQMAAIPGERLMVSNKLKDQIKGLPDLKGHTIGVTGLGSSTNFLANYLVTKGGNTSKDYTPIPVGAGQTLIAAMQQGKIDLAVTTEPTVSLLVSKNIASVLVDMNTVEGTKQALGGNYPSTSLYMMSSYVKDHPEVVQHLANAFVKTLKWINTHTPEEITDKLPKEYYAGDKDMYLTALKSTLPMFSADGKMPADAPQKVLEVLSAINPKLKDAGIKLDQTYTTQFVDKALQAK
ncbi:ABC transporter substrate-binding protein [Paenibacillus alginolyticus]|uniref:ABC transporter substrate-binding protein n=1 Tax=Paenibacillus alginolyticus TaxID=59839 RepID=A0ABT4G5Y7_9BACL|nr:ABC transporter substrate-binding protein [Paenibacillus alginolyticus]MCY9691572.1 ABC transporter substrate-binding protein [Paenibacillus alginolyticus]MEC0146992.1 ABC transporter substrate-binding protein [Paenibacillus alginolyticus]